MHFAGVTKHYLIAVLAKMRTGSRLKQARQSTFASFAQKHNADIALYAAVGIVDPLSRKPENTYAKIHPRWSEYTHETEIQIVEESIRYAAIHEASPNP